MAKWLGIRCCAGVRRIIGIVPVNLRPAASSLILWLVVCGFFKRQKETGRLGVFCEFRSGEKAIHFGRASFVILLISISFSLSILLAQLGNGEVEEGKKRNLGE